MKNLSKVQQYRVALSGLGGSLGDLVYSAMEVEDESDVVAGFISKILPDNCAEFTLFQPIVIEMPDGAEITAAELSPIDLLKTLIRVEHEKRAVHTRS